MMLATPRLSYIEYIDYIVTKRAHMGSSRSRCGLNDVTNGYDLFSNVYILAWQI